jgi:DNA-directed RNA polymerase specialized sigma24 family protein
MRLSSLLAHFSLRFTPPDGSSVASIRKGLRERLGAAGWSQAGTRGDGGATAWRPTLPATTVARRANDCDEGFRDARVEAYQDVLEEMGPRAEHLKHMMGPSNDLPPPEAEVDAGLLTSFVHGEVAAFDSLVERHAGRLHGQARRWLPATDAVDAVEETFMALFEGAAALLERRDVKIGGFLFGTLRIKILRALHARGRAWFLFGLLVPFVSGDGLTALLRQEGASKLAHHLEQECNPLEQEVMALALENRSAPEIAAELGIPRTHVRFIRWRARTKLRCALAQ